MSDVLRNAFNNALCDELAARARADRPLRRSTLRRAGLVAAGALDELDRQPHASPGGKRAATDCRRSRRRVGRPRTPGRVRYAVPIAADELLGKLLLAAKEACEVIASASEEKLLAMIPIKRYDLNGIEAVVRCIAHFRGHARRSST